MTLAHFLLSDVDVLFNFTISIETMVFRGLDMNISTQVFVDNNDTTPFDFSSNGVNFNITMYLSDTEDIAQRSSHLENLNIVPVNYLETRTLKRGLMGKESLEEEIVFEVRYPVYLYNKLSAVI